MTLAVPVSECICYLNMCPMGCEPACPYCFQTEEVRDEASPVVDPASPSLLARERTAESVETIAARLVDQTLNLDGFVVSSPSTYKEGGDTMANRSMGAYVVLVTDEDGTAHAFGPVGSGRIDRYVELAAEAFPLCHVRAMLIRSRTDFYDMIGTAQEQKSS